MSADTLTSDGAPVTLAPPPPENLGAGSYAYTQTGFAVMGGNPDEVVIASGDGTQSAAAAVISGYDLSGNLLFRDWLPSTMGPSAHPEVATISGGGVAASWYEEVGGMQGEPLTYRVLYTPVSADGSMSGGGYAGGGSDTATGLQTFTTADGFALEWQAATSSYPYSGEQYTEFDRYNPDGTVISNNNLDGTGPFPYADIAIGGHEFRIQDNQAQLSGQPAVTVPGEPAHAMTQVAAAALTDGHSAAVAWVDSGTEHLSIYDASANSFSPNLTLDWGGASDTHVVALPDGGFAVSWLKGGAYYGEVFDAVGDGGGKISLTGNVAAINSHGDLYTVGLDANGNEVVQTYAISGSGGSTGGGGTSGGSSSSVSTSDPDYTAPEGVTTITLTGSNQTIHANNDGDTIFSDDTKNVLIGGTGADVFHIGRAGDTVTGGAGADVFAYGQVPWGGSTITDFQSGDTIDLTGLMATTHDTGTDGFADGYLKISSDSSGNAQVWANYNETGNDNWWLVTTLNGVSTYNLQTSGDTITWTSNPGSGGGSTGGGGTSGAAPGPDTLAAKGEIVELPPTYPPSGTAVTYSTVQGADEVVVAYDYNGEYRFTGYDLSGNQLFSDLGAEAYHFSGVGSFTLASGGPGFLLAYTHIQADNPGGPADTGYYAFYDPSGNRTEGGAIQYAEGLTAFAGRYVDHLEWNTQDWDSSGQLTGYTLTGADVGGDGRLGTTTTGGTGASPLALTPYARTPVGSMGDLVISDNSAQLGSHAAVTLPGEPAHALSDVAAAGLASGAAAAVAWVDSGTEHLSIYDALGNSFGANLTLDWGGASDTHVVALPDGGFVVSWMNNGAYYGEVFDSAGDGGGKISLAGDAAGVDSAGNLYTVGLGSNGEYQLQIYAVNGSGSPPPTTVYTSDPDYTAPNGVATIYLTGSDQTIHANNGGDTIWSDDTKNVLIGGTGNDTFHIGRAGDTITGGGGNDTFAYAQVPWGGSTITDFHTGDRIDLTGLLADEHAAASDPFISGNLAYETDSAGNAQIWGNYTQPGNDNAWLIVTLDGVSTSSLHYSNGVIT